MKLLRRYLSHDDTCMCRARVVQIVRFFLVSEPAAHTGAAHFVRFADGRAALEALARAARDKMGAVVHSVEDDIRRLEHALTLADVERDTAARALVRAARRLAANVRAQCGSDPRPDDVKVVCAAALELERAEAKLEEKRLTLRELERSRRGVPSDGS